jgi:hypothetical protein
MGRMRPPAISGHTSRSTSRAISAFSRYLHEVAAIDARGRDFDQDLLRAGFPHRDLLDDGGGRAFDLARNDGAHACGQGRHGGLLRGRENNGTI